MPDGPRLRVALAQQPLRWLDPEGNRSAFASVLAPLAGRMDLLVLPEMFTTGFSMEPQVWAEPEEGPTLGWMRAQAAALDAALAGSCMVRDATGQARNRLLFVTPEGDVSHYDKRHLFRMGGEERHYAAGTVRRVVEFRGCRIALLVCYDLRFPVWSRRDAVRFDYDVLLYVANWPAARGYAWRQLLVARAIENQAYVLGVNRVGEDGHGVAHDGGSVVLDPLGQPLASAVDGEACMIEGELDLGALRRFREKFPAHLDADRFELTP